MSTNKKFIKYVTQSTLGTIGLSVYLLADTFFISWTGANGITVLGLALPLYGFIFAIGAMIGIGSATRYLITRMQGGKADFYFCHALIWQIIFSLPFVLTGIFAPKAYLTLVGGDAEIVALGSSYTTIVLIGAPFFMMNYAFTAFARNDNGTTVAMLASLCGSAFNIAFDYIFMFPMGMGLKGAALATAMAPAVTMLVTLIHFLGKKSTVTFKLVRPSIRRLFACIQLGFSAFVGEISSAITVTVFNTILLHLAGNIGVAAYSIIANYALVAMAFFNGLSQGTQPLLSESYGSGDQKQTRAYFVRAIGVALVFEAAIVSVAWLFTEPLIALFNGEGNEQLAAYAYTGMRIYFLGYLLAGINIFLVNYFSAIAQAGEAFVASLMRGMIAITLSAIVLSTMFGMTGVWFSLLSAETITFAIILMMLLRRKRHTSKMAHES